MLGRNSRRLIVGLAALMTCAGQISSRADTPRPQGKLVYWGNDSGGAMGNVPAGDDFVAAVIGYGTNLALRADGSIAPWGDDTYELISGAPAGTGHKSIAIGGLHALAIRADGSIVGWGVDYSGLNSHIPAGNDFIAVSSGGYHSLALRADGSLASWGWSPNLVQVRDTPTGTGFVAIASNGDHNVALRADGSLVDWGYDAGNRPMHIEDTGFKAIAAGMWHTLALRTDGSLASWGNDDFGQVSQTPSGTGFVAVACGGLHSMALRANGTIVSWGANDYGEVSATPSASAFGYITGGWLGSVAIQTGVPPIITVPTSVLGVAGQPITFKATASDPNGDAFTLELINAPAGMTFNTSTGAIAWTPPTTVSGTFMFDVRATDSHGLTAAKTVTVLVNPAKTAIFKLNQSNLTLIREGNVVTATFNIDNTSTGNATGVSISAGQLQNKANYIKYDANGPLPGPYTIPSGGSQHMSVSFSGVPSGISATLTITLAYDGGTVNFSRVVQVP